ncbi:MAG: LuxR family transcriptional regulator [Bacillota bacterium]
MVNWILFFPYYGPALTALNLNDSILPHLFTVTHIAGLLAGSWVYFSSVEQKFAQHCGKTTPFIIALLTVAFLFFNNAYSPILGIFFFVIMGIASGWIAGRWMTWFSSSDTASVRGSVLGISIGITYTLLTFNILVMAVPGNGKIYSLVFSSLAILIGGILTNQLPVRPKQPASFSIRSMLPPLDLLLFGVFAYATVSLIYRSILTSHIQQPALSWLVLIPYILTGLFLGKWSDKYDRYYFTIFAYFVIGLGFLIQAVSPTSGFSNILVGIFILTGLICIHLFYWLSLVDRQNTMFTPFPVVIGVSIELMSCAVVFTVVPLISPDPDITGKIVGVAGVVFILAGFLVTSFFNYRFSRRLFKDIKPAANSIAQGTLFTKKKEDLRMPLLYYFYNIDQKIIEKTLTGQFNLTNKETEIAHLVLIGHKNIEITKLLYISPNTLKYHMKNIYSKIGASNRADASAIVLSSIQTLDDRGTAG